MALFDLLIGPRGPALVRYTGLWRDALLAWLYDGSSQVVVGSNGGQAGDPQWVHNRRAHPEAEIFVPRTLQIVPARLLEGEEHQRVWDKITKTVPLYADYQLMPTINAVAKGAGTFPCLYWRWSE